MPTFTSQIIKHYKPGMTAIDVAKELGYKWSDKEYNTLNATFQRLKKSGRLGPADSSEAATEAPPEMSLQDKIKADFDKIHESARNRELKSKYNHLLSQYEESEKRFDALVGIKQAVDIHSIPPIIRGSKHEAVPVVMLSDWHFEETVFGATINNLNEYNLDIASARWNKCIQNSMRLVAKERQSSDIEQIVIWLGGDFITGYIHEELEESNGLSPTQATRFAKEKIINALNFYIAHGKFKKITVVCNYGNHGRTNKKPRVSTGYKNSYEWMMYMDIADYFSNNKSIDFVIPNGLFAYVEVLGYINRFWHGDTIQYGGGIGGLTVPLIKAIQRYDSTIKADYNFMGHYHQFWEATKNCMVNGSGIGFNAYAQRIGASCEPPQQGFKMIDSKYGYTTKLQIVCT
jgi:hypothetical protein